MLHSYNIRRNIRTILWRRLWLPVTFTNSSECLLDIDGSVAFCSLKLCVNISFDSGR